MSGKFGAQMDVFTSNSYRRLKIAMLTGWTMDYIDNELGFLDAEVLLHVWEAEQRLIKG